MKTKTSRILIVDDDKDLCMSLAIILNRQGLSVTTANDGQSAIAASKENDFDLILIDVIMPSMNGLDTLLALNEFAPNARKVMMTGFAVTGLVAGAINAGIDGVLYKPFNVDLVVKNILGEDLIQVFEGYLQSVWDRIVPVTGIPTAQLIFNQSIEKTFTENSTLLKNIKVTQNGFSLSGIRDRVNLDDDVLPDEELRPHLQRLLAEVFDLLSILTGDMLTSPLIEKLSDHLKTEKE